MAVNRLRHLINHHGIFERRSKTWSFLSSSLHKTASNHAKDKDNDSKEYIFREEDPETDLLNVNDSHIKTRGKEDGARKKWVHPKKQFEKRLKFNRSLRDVQMLLDGEVLFGLHPVLITLEQNRRPLHRLFVKDSISRDEGLFGRIVQLAEERSIEILPVPVKVLDALSKGSSHQGVCLDAFSRQYNTITDEQLDVITSDDTRRQLWLYLDKIQDPRNVGAIIRSSHYFGVEKIFVPKENSCRLSPVVHKASSGALELMNLYALKDEEEFLQGMKDRGWDILGTAGGEDDQDPSSLRIDVDKYSSEQNTVLLLGNEGKGLSQNLLKFCDSLLTVKPKGILNASVDSLNISVATGILLHCLTRGIR